MSARDDRHEQGRAGAAISESAATAANGRGSGAQGAVRPHRLDAREEAEAKAMIARDDKLAAALRDYWEDDARPDDTGRFRAILARHGLAVLPVEPTEKMVRRARECRPLREDDSDPDNMDSNTRGTWIAMLAAAKEDRDDDR